MEVNYMRAIGTYIPVRERIRRAWKALRTSVDPIDYNANGWTSASNTTWATTTDELREFSPEARESIERGLSQQGTIDRGSFAQYLDTPNAETEAAIREAETGENCKYFDSLDDMYRELDE